MDFEELCLVYEIEDSVRFLEDLKNLDLKKKSKVKMRTLEYYFKKKSLIK